MLPALIHASSLQARLRQMSKSLKLAVWHSWHPSCYFWWHIKGSWAQRKTQSNKKLWLGFIDISHDLLLQHRATFQSRRLCVTRTKGICSEFGRSTCQLFSSKSAGIVSSQWGFMRASLHVSIWTRSLRPVRCAVIIKQRRRIFLQSVFPCKNHMTLQLLHYRLKFKTRTWKILLTCGHFGFVNIMTSLFLFLFLLYELLWHKYGHVCELPDSM